MGGNQKLEQRFISYGSYHHNAINKWIHILCVPLIFTSALALIHHIKVFEVSGHSVPLSAVLLGVHLLYYLSFSIPIGLLCTAIYAGYWYAIDYLSKAYPENFFKNALILHAACWSLQFIGHGVFEKRKPALLDNLGQVVTAPMFVVIQVLCLFTMGDFHNSVEPRIQQNVTAFHQKDQQKTAKAK